MYKEHEACTPPSPDAILWRYMDFIKFVSILEKQALFFSRVDKLEDPFEGFWPTANRVNLENLFERIPLPLRNNARQTMRSFIKALPRFTLINCWHESPDESAAMWKLYSKDDNGIAIKTNFGSLAKSFTTSEAIHIGRISYIDYETHFIPEGWRLRAFLCKRKSFEHEHEIRAIVQKHSERDRISLSEDPNDEREGKFNFFQDICDVGNYYEVDLSLLIQEVIVSPYAPDWLLELVQSVAARYNLKAQVVKSSLADLPTWS